MQLTRVFAIVLALSGIWFLPIAWFPVFWPGLLLWVGWVAIAIGVKRTDRPWFWFCCAFWNGYWLLELFSDTDWTGHKAFVYWYVRMHVVASVGLSIGAIFLLSRRTKAVRKH